MTSRSSPASLRGVPREAQEGPKRRQGRPKTAPRAANRAPRAAQMRSQSGLSHLGPTWRPRAPRRPPAPSGVDFGRLPRGLQGALGVPFWTFRSPSRLHFRTSRASFRELLVQPCFARLGSEDAGTSSAAGSTGIGRRGAALEFWCFGRHVSCAGLLILFVRVPACFPLSLRCFLDLTDTRANVETMLNVVLTPPEPIPAPSWESMYGQC